MMVPRTGFPVLPFGLEALEFRAFAPISIFQTGDFRGAQQLLKQNCKKVVDANH
jgi:hypothetical protein